MIKKITFLLVLLSSIQICNAQFLWYENETNTNHIKYIDESAGSFTEDVTNPSTIGINENSIVSQFNRNEGTKAFLNFDLNRNITNLSNFSIAINAYLDLPNELLTINNTKIRMYLSSSKSSKQVYIQLKFTVGQEWESFTFDFNGVEVPDEIIAVNGFDGISIGFANGVTTEPATTYYLDSISGSKEQAPLPADWLAGSWGITFPVYGGERLDSEIAGGYDYIAGAQEIVENLPASGHVITNLSNFAKSYYFTLRGNENVDIASEIDESFVPSLENEAIMLEVLEIFRNAGKKNILYISTNYFDRLDDETHALWVTYYTNEFGGDEYLAYRDLVQGFVLRMKDYVDGYWLDTTAELDDDGHIEDFVQMFRDAHPGAAISASPNGAYFTDENGELIKVDSDGLDDEDDRDYRIVSFEGVNNYQDYTSGHVTPLGQGAPPNSWAYEEFTMPAMVEDPWGEYEGKTILKHAWFPMRDKWHVSSANLIFGTEDAYRFTRTLVDAGAGVTFANTVDDVDNKGYMMAEEMVIMKEINDRLLSNPMVAYEPYIRPVGAHLVGEEPSLSINSVDLFDVKMYPNPVKDKLTITSASKDVVRVIIMSSTGSKVVEKKWDNGSTKLQLDLTILKPGIYFVNLSNGTNTSTTRRIIISK